MKTFDEVAEEYAINMGLGQRKFMTLDFSYQDLKKISIIYARQACAEQARSILSKVEFGNPQKNELFNTPIIELK